MGCHHSKVEEQVATPEAPATGDLVIHSAAAEEVTAEVVAPVEEAAKPEEEVVAAVVPAEETPVVAEPAVAAAPVEEVAAEAPVVDVEKVAVEAPVEAAVEAPVEAAVEAPVEAAAVVEAAPAVEEVAPVAEETPVVVAEEIKSTEAVASETPAVVEEPVSAAAETAAEPESESAPAEEAAATITFETAGVAIDGRVVFYQFTLADKEDPAHTLTVRKRFTDFKLLHEQIAKLMASETNVPAADSDKFKTYPALPALPKAGVSSVLFGRRNKNLAADREAQFGKILNAIARHPIAYESEAFKAFCA